MSHTIRELREATDDELIAAHDEQAKNTFVGVSYYLDELRRREQAAAMRSSHRLAVASMVLAVVSAIGSIAAVWVAVLALR